MTVISDSTLDIPDTAVSRVEFISQIHTNPSTELVPLPIRGIDTRYLKRYIRALEDAGFDYTLVPYGSAGADSFVLASAVGQLSDTLKPIVALRPNTTFPLVAAQQLATLDQLTQGRAIVHLISGGNDAEQARQGDYLPKDRRYARTADIGADLVSIRGYDNLNDTVDYGRSVIPLVRQELAHRAATGRRGGIQAEHPGALAPGFDAAALAGL
jgi:hypothetical protein